MSSRVWGSTQSNILNRTKNNNFNLKTKSCDKSEDIRYELRHDPFELKTASNHLVITRNVKISRHLIDIQGSFRTYNAVDIKEWATNQ